MISAIKLCRNRASSLHFFYFCRQHFYLFYLFSNNSVKLDVKMSLLFALCSTENFIFQPVNLPSGRRFLSPKVIFLRSKGAFSVGEIPDCPKICLSNLHRAVQFLPCNIIRHQFAVLKLEATFNHIWWVFKLMAHSIPRYPV